MSVERKIITDLKKDVKRNDRHMRVLVGVYSSLLVVLACVNFSDVLRITLLGIFSFCFWQLKRIYDKASDNLRASIDIAIREQLTKRPTSEKERIEMMRNVTPKKENNSDPAINKSQSMLKRMFTSFNKFKF